MGRLEPETNAEGLAAALRALGFTRLVTFTEAEADALGVPHARGVLAQEIAEGSPVAERIPAGSVITEVFGAPVGSVDELYLRIIRAPSLSSRGLDVPVRVRRPDGSEAAVVLPLRPPSR
jgi:S1-C subfamily serine protease